MIKLYVGLIMGYKGRAKEILEKYNVSPWDEIEVEGKGLRLRAILLPGPETSEYVYLKLTNGYNLAFHVNNIKHIRRIGHIESKYTLPRLVKQINPELPEVALIHAGGTIASRVDYATGAIAPAFTPEELSWAIPEMFDVASWRFRELFNIFSENIRPQHWILLAEAVYQEFNAGAKSVIITHGTDTMHFSATAIAFMVEHPLGSIIFTGAMRSSDRPASDAATNLVASALLAIDAKIQESVIVMHKTPSDTLFAAHRGVRSMKLHSTRRDAFRSIGIAPLAEIDLLHKRVTYNQQEIVNHSDDIKLLNKFDEKVALLYVYPGFPHEFIDVLIDKRYKGIVLAGTGMGHVPEGLFSSIKRAIDEDVVIIMTTQCYWGGVYMNVYETGRKLIELGVVSGRTLLPHVAYIKLGWLLGLGYEGNELRELILRNLRGEFVERESLVSF